MATVHPFPGIIYGPGKASDLRRVLAPPFDSLDREAQVGCLQKDSANIAHLLVGETGDAATLDRWLADGTLVRRPAPALYYYTQEYSVGIKKRTLRAFFARAQAEAPGQGSLVALQEPDPNTRGDAPMPRQTGASIEPVVMLYHGASASPTELLQPLESAAPLLETADESGVVHRLWEATGETLIAGVQERMAGAKLALAAGAEAYQLSLSRGEPRVSAFVDVDSEGFVTRSVNRVVHVPDDFDFNQFFERLGNSFDVYPLYGPDAIQGLLDKATPGEVRLVTFIARPRRCLLMVPKPSLPEFGQAHSEGWRKLDSAILDHVVIAHVTGVGADKQSDPAWLSYRRGVDACVQTLQNQGTYRIAFLLNPARVEQIKQLVFSGEPLPPRALEIHPRIPAGLVIG